MCICAGVEQVVLPLPRAHSKERGVSNTTYSGRTHACPPVQSFAAAKFNPRAEFGFTLKVPFRSIMLAVNGNQTSIHHRMIDATTLAQMNGAYAMPADAGSAWRAAHDAGVDMSLIEYSLSLTPEQRLTEHQQVLDFLLEVQAANRSHAPK
jgi:hypothetical protein